MERLNIVLESGMLEVSHAPSNEIKDVERVPSKLFFFL